MDIKGVEIIGFYKRMLIKKKYVGKNEFRFFMVLGQKNNYFRTYMGVGARFFYLDVRLSLVGFKH